MGPTIHKYTLDIVDRQLVTMPKSAIPLSVGEQNGGLVLWAQVDTRLAPYDYAVSIRGTGHPIRGDEGRFVGTVQAAGGFVWHVFFTD